jgi:serine/threonine-protein kinase
MALQGALPYLPCMGGDAGGGDTTGVAPYSHLGSPVQPGEVIAERYRVLHELGRGGMGLVVAAEHLYLPQRVAIKFLIDAAHPSTRLRFSREAATVVQLRSEHVRRVLDVGTLPGGEPYMVMELLEGHDLQDVVAQRGPLPVPEVVDYALQTCEALAEAHGMGVVHRDLKPSNLFLARSVDGSAVVKVMDFGIAKAGETDSGAQQLTQSGVAMGSPRFMAPEQLVSSRDVDARADIWALGVTMYELLTGQPAFLGETAAELHVAILQQEPRRPSELRPDVPPSVEQAVARCLRKEASDRWAHVGELALALEPAAPPHAKRYVERIQRMVGASGGPATPAVVHTPVGLPHDPRVAMAPTAQAQAPTAGGGSQAQGASGVEVYGPPGHGVTTGAPVVHAGPSASTTMASPGRERRSGLFLGLGIGGVVTALAVVAVVFALRGGEDEEAGLPCYFEKCDDSTHVDLNRPLQPELYLEPATAIVRTLEPTAKLTTISFSGVRGRGFDRKHHANLSFTFRYRLEGGGYGLILAMVNTEQLMARYVDRGGKLALVEPPRCSFQQALEAARADADYPADELIAGTYTQYLEEPAWIVTTEDGSPHRIIDGDCHPIDVSGAP